MSPSKRAQTAPNAHRERTSFSLDAANVNVNPWGAFDRTIAEPRRIIDVPGA